MVQCILSCQIMQQRTTLDLSDRLMDMSSVDFSKCKAVYEDGSYDIYFQSDRYRKNDIESIDVCVNGERVGGIALNPDTETVEGYTKYNESLFAKQPFLLHYDLVTLSFIMNFTNGASKELFSEFLLCMSKSQEDTSNIQKILQELIAFDDTQVGEWIFSYADRGASNSLYAGKWNKHAYKSLSSYIQLLEQVIACYKNNFAYFKTQGKNTIKRTEVLVPYEKVKQVSRDSFNWILQNADQLAAVPYTSGGFSFMVKTSYHIKSEQMQAEKAGMFMKTELSSAF